MEEEIMTKKKRKKNVKHIFEILFYNYDGGKRNSAT